VPYGPALMTLRTTPLVTRLQARSGGHACRVRASSRVMWRGRRGGGGRRKRGAVRRHPPARGRTTRQRSVASSSRTIIAPRRAWDSRAARAS